MSCSKSYWICIFFIFTRPIINSEEIPWIFWISSRWTNSLKSNRGVFALHWTFRKTFIVIHHIPHCYLEFSHFFHCWSMSNKKHFFATSHFFICIKGPQHNRRYIVVKTICFFLISFSPFFKHLFSF